MLASAPAVMMAVAGVSGAVPFDQANAPRPNHDPEAIPDGKVITGDKSIFSVSLSGVTDYRFRGISLSAGHAALQASAEMVSPTGLYAGTWGSTIDGGDGVRGEVDAYGGYRAKVVDTDLDIGIISYFYPGSEGISSAEVYASGAHAIGDTTVKVGISYTPHQNQLGDGLYLFTEAEKPLPGLPVTLHGHFGRETGVSTPTGATKIDWLLGADVQTSLVTLSIAWVDARYRGRRAEPHHYGNVVAAIAFDF